MTFVMYIPTNINTFDQVDGKVKSLFQTLHV